MPTRRVRLRACIEVQVGGVTARCVSGACKRRFVARTVVDDFRTTYVVLGGGGLVIPQRMTSSATGRLLSRPLGLGGVECFGGCGGGGRYLSIIERATL